MAFLIHSPNGEGWEESTWEITNYAWFINVQSNMYQHTHTNTNTHTHTYMLHAISFTFRVIPSGKLLNLLFKL